MRLDVTEMIGPVEDEKTQNQQESTEKEFLKVHTNNGSTWNIQTIQKKESKHDDKVHLDMTGKTKGLKTLTDENYKSSPT